MTDLKFPDGEAPVDEEEAKEAVPEPNPSDSEPVETPNEGPADTGEEDPEGEPA